MNKIKKEALALLRLLHAKEKKYRNLNNKIRDLAPEFTPYTQSIDDQYYTGVVKLLDEIIGETWASYLLFECNPEGLVTIDGKDFKIRNVDDIIKYMKYRDE